MMKQAQPTDPCKRCYLQGICDRDECGRKLYQTDTNKKPK